MVAKNKKIRKISILYDFLKETGGLERVLFFQAENIRKIYDVNLFFGYVSDKAKEKILSNFKVSKNLSINQFGNSKREIPQLIKYFLNPRLTKIDSDLLISHSYMSTVASFSKNKKDGTPFIAFIHHPPQYLYDRNIKYVNNLPRLFAYILGVFFSPFMRKTDRKAVRAASKILVNSIYTAKRVKEIYGVSPIVLYPPIDKSFKILSPGNYKKTIESLGIENKFILLHGRMIKDKRPDLAIKSFSMLKDKKMNLVISGSIEQEKKIDSLIKDLNISGRVKILGRVSSEELVSLYNSAECFLMTAPKEDFGLTPIEAMACGCPVVAWDDEAGPSETVVEGINGFLAKPYSLNDYTLKIEEALSKRWDKRKIEKSVKKFGSQKISSLLLDEIKEIFDKL